jgi:tripartite-type tricarboxylate transporter receptor subunit TctC
MKASFMYRNALAFIALLGVCPFSPVSAQSWPSGQVRIVPPYAPGGGTDILGRAIAQKLSERGGPPAIVDNRAGANGTIGAAYVAKAAPDGHTLLIVPAGYAANPALYKSLPYDPSRDLVGISHLASGPLILVVHPSLPARSVKEFVALAKNQPGAINCGSAGNGSLPHLSLELFNLMSGTRITHIPYKGSGTAIADVLGGQVPVYFMNILQSLPLIKSGRLRALGVTSPARSPIAPQVPAIAEGGLPGFDMTNWYGLFAPAATPRETIARVQAEMSRILNAPDLKQRLADDGMTVVASTPDAFAQFLRRETAKFNRVIDSAGIKGSM